VLSTKIVDLRSLWIRNGWPRPLLLGVHTRTSCAKLPSKHSSMLNRLSVFGSSR
jgi:hypothetical protein